ncbi:MAG: histidine phosphatase family protein [Bacteroidota bacterium]
MKTLYLLRHGKSDWSADYTRDFDRPLAKRGRNAADRMGAFFVATLQSVDRAVSSPAVRARRTAERFLVASASSTTLLFDERLYHGDEQSLLEVAAEQPCEVEALLLVGHEPTWSEATAHLIGGGDVRFPTAALARIDLHIDTWDDIDEDTGDLIWFVTPRLLKPLLRRS